MALNVIVLGPPGTGKGTQAEWFAREHGVPKISTGDILREAVQAGTELGRQAKAIMEAGRLVGDDIMIGIVRERLDRPDARRGFVLDGFPRTVAQAEALDRIVAGRDPLVVVDIVVPEEELLRRMVTRLICGRCGATASPADGGGPAPACQKCGGAFLQRSDDSETVARERLRVYQRDTRPLVEYYRVRPNFRSINGDQPPDRIAAAIRAAVVSGASQAPGAEPAGRRS